MSDRDSRGRFMPGVSGNPAGKPKGAVSLKTVLQERIAEPIEHGRSYADALIDSTLTAALDGDAQARKLVFEYIDGRPHQAIALDAQAELVTIIDNIPRHSEDEIAEAFMRWERGEKPQTSDEASMWWTFDTYGPTALALIDEIEQIESASGGGVE